jgi:hypothetical protein
MGKTIWTVGELREALKDFDENDDVVIETTDEDGDEEDLFPFCVDSMKLDERHEDGKHKLEIRFVQQSQEIWKAEE